MEEQSKQPAAIVNDAFDEIEIEPIADISDQLVFEEGTAEADDEVQWVISVNSVESNQNNGADTEEALPRGSEFESEHYRIEEEAAIPTRKLDSAETADEERAVDEPERETSIPTHKLDDSLKAASAGMVENEVGKNAEKAPVNQLDHLDSLLQELSMLDQKQDLIGEDIPDPFADDLEKIASPEKISILDRPLAPIAETPAKLQSNDSTDVNRLLAELDKLEELEQARLSGNLSPSTASLDKPKTEKPIIEKPKLPSQPGLPKPTEATTESKDVMSADVQQILDELKKLEEREKTRPSKPLPSLPGVEKAKEEKAKASKTEEKDESVDVNQLLDELRKLEAKTKKEFEKKPLKSSTGPLSPPVKSKQTSRLDASEDAAIKRTLAEMSFIEGNESIAEGNRASAVKHYREACKYAPDNVQYILKLVDLLTEESTTKLEAEELLTKGMEASPTNFELRSKLAELRGEKKGAAAALDANAAKVQDLKTELKRDKTGRLKRVKFAAADVLTLPNRISVVNQAIIGIILGIAIWSIVVSIRTEPVKINLKLIVPPDETSVSLNKIEFEWQGAADKFLLQVEENGVKVFERTVLETVYALKPEDRALLKPDRRYTWRVVPCNKTSEPLPYVEDDSNFKTIK